MRSWFYHPGAAIIGGFCRLLFGLRVEGVERIPRNGAFIVVANHCSNLDPPMLGWATGHQIGRIVHFMAKIEMRRWPIIGWLATQSGVYFVRRGEGDGYEYIAETGPAAKALPAFGFAIRPWMTIDYPRYRGVGRFESARSVLPEDALFGNMMFPGKMLMELDEAAF